MAQIPRADEGRNCPFSGKDCSEACHKCPMWVQVRGTNPNTGGEIDRWDCSFALLPMLLIENAQQSRQTGAAVESFRNEVAERADRGPRLIGSQRVGHDEMAYIGASQRMIEG